MYPDVPKPVLKSVSPNLSSRPSRKRPGRSFEALEGTVIGRSHRSREGKAKLKEVIDLAREVLPIPYDYRIVIVPRSDTGAVEMAIWGLLGPCGVDVFAWESFVCDWVKDIAEELETEDRRVFVAPYGELPGLSRADPARDTVRVRVPDGLWVADDRTDLTICGATSAAFAMDLPWSKLGVATWSSQKVLGSEGAYGMIVLSPRAIERLTDDVPSWPGPKFFRMVARGLVSEGLFVCETIDTPSLLTDEDAIDGLSWARDLGGLPALKERCRANSDRAAAWIERTDWCDFLVGSDDIRCETSICFKIIASDFASSPGLQVNVANAAVARLAEEKVAFDIGACRTAPPGFRFWSGATVDASDLAIAFEWLNWAYYEARKMVMA